MNTPIHVSIIICSCDRAEHLRQTLEAIGRLPIPPEYQCDLTVVDNASADDTGEMVNSFHLGNMPLHYLLEPQRGLAYAYNAGAAATSGEILLYTDDDVRPPADWLDGLCGPIATGAADAVAGGVKMASHLTRPWIKPAHVGWLASTEYLPEGATTPMIGASMAFARRVLERVPKFDVEVRQGMDSLFSYQLEKAGYRIGMALDTVAEHHLQESRLSRKSFVTIALRRAETNAYITRHWSHSDPPYPYVSLARSYLILWALRLWHFPEWVTSPTVPAWELPRLERVRTVECYLKQRQEPRHYEKFGLAKLKGKM